MAIVSFLLALLALAVAIATRLRPLPRVLKLDKLTLARGADSTTIEPCGLWVERKNLGGVLLGIENGAFGVAGAIPGGGRFRLTAEPDHGGMGQLCLDSSTAKFCAGPSGILLASGNNRSAYLQNGMNTTDGQNESFVGANRMATQKCTASDAPPATAPQSAKPKQLRPLETLRNPHGLKIFAADELTPVA